VRGLRLHVRRGGSGAPVVLVHGIGVSGRYLVPLGRELARDRAVSIPDLPGFGESDRPRRSLGVLGLAEALLAYLDAAGLERPPLVANSMGCQVVAALAARNPERTGPLGLVGPTVDPHRRSAARQVLGGMADCVREPPSLLAIIAWDYCVFGPRRFVATARSALRDRIERNLRLVESPALVLRGEHDGFVSPRWAEEAAALLPRGRLVVVPGEPHAVHYTRPRLVAGVVRRFLEEVEDGGR
jgi:2-hydroxy-6-oxonona-2,4-dienedioate hydrolase